MIHNKKTLQVRLDPTIHLDAYNYSLAISACTRQTMWREACILFQQMPQGRAPRRWQFLVVQWIWEKMMQSYKAGPP